VSTPLSRLRSYGVDELRVIADFLKRTVDASREATNELEAK
jgi:hypothetical protein